MALEGLFALSLAWGSLQLGQVYASEGQCSAGLTALDSGLVTAQTVANIECNKENTSSDY